jgi:hypothetical protein
MAKPEERKNGLTAIERRQVVRWATNQYWEKFEKNKPKAPEDLTFTKFMQLLEVMPEVDNLYTKELIRKINKKSEMSKWSEEVLIPLKSFSKEVKFEETSETLKDDLMKLYIDFQVKNDPSLTAEDIKKITASKITVWKFLDFLMESNQNIGSIPNLRKHGVNSLNWKMSHLKMEALTKLKELLPKS